MIVSNQQGHIQANLIRDDLRDQCVQQAFEEQVERTPDALAAWFDGQGLSYRELDARANRLGHHLRSLGVGPDGMVGLCVDRSLEMIVAVLGILKAGGAYVPLDPGLPQQRLAYQMSNSGCTVVITQASWLPLLEQVLTGESQPLPVCLVLDAPGCAWSGGSAEKPGQVNAPHHLAYVLYTSGSTGRPKGVEMPHRGLVNLLTWQCANSGMGIGNRTLQFASLGFDVSFQEIFATWLSGGTLVLVADEIRKDSAALLAFIARENIERIFVPYYVLERLAEVAASRDHLPGGLKEVWVAGEQLRIGADIRRCFGGLPACRLWNQYGPTEAHVVTSHELRGPAAEWPDLPPIGRPLPNCRIYLLDDGAQPVPAGEPGELYIGGVALARGYLNAPALTAERFVADPFGTDPRARMYKTGDRARYMPDGNIEFLGRLDQQIKIRGYRIELGEIEAVLAGYPDLTACTVVPRTYRGGESILAAFVMARSDAGLSAGALRKWLGEKLPEYMIPTSYYLLDALPLTPNGKVDRQALETFDGEAMAAGTDCVAARNEVEAKLVEIWQRVFHRRHVWCHDNFFDLGGHSLLAVRLTAEIEKHLGYKLPIAALFRLPTIKALARRISEDGWTPLWNSLVPLQPSGSKPPIFFIHGWGGDVYGFMGLAQLLGPDQPVYGIQAVGLDGTCARHTTVESMAAHYVQEIRSFQPEGPYFLAGYSLGGLIAFEVAQQLQRNKQRVAMLALLDSDPSGGLSWTAYGKILVPYLRERCVFHLRRWWNTPHHDRGNYLRERWAELRSMLAHNRRKSVATTLASLESVDSPQVPGFGDYYHAVVSTYRARTYPGTVDFFISDESSARCLTLWRHLICGGISFHRIPCPHEEMISSAHVVAVASALRTALSHARGKSATPATRGLHSDEYFVW